MTSAQLATLKADILADGALNAFPNNSDGASAIAAVYNTIASPNFFVYRIDVPPQDIYDQVVWANLTPTDAPDTTTQWQNRSLSCQGKQFNLQILVQGQTRINASKANIRAGLQDALTNVPSGISGAPVSAGWVGVRDNALARKATRVEKLFATGGNGSTAALAGTMGVEGVLTWQDVDTARNS